MLRKTMIVLATAAALRAFMTTTTGAITRRTTAALRPRTISRRRSSLRMAT
jgi:hypothetical protein